MYAVLYLLCRILPRDAVVARGEHRRVKKTFTMTRSGTFSSRLQTDFLSFHVRMRVCSGKHGNRAGSFRNESGYSRRNTQISSVLLEGRSCDNFGVLIARSSIFVPEKNS